MKVLIALQTFEIMIETVASDLEKFEDSYELTWYRNRVCVVT